MSTLPLELSNFFLAMQAGTSGLEQLTKLFHEKATYSEPFSGQSEPHLGRNSIIAAFKASQTEGFRDAVIELHSVELADDEVHVHWTCYSQAIPGGQGSGLNVFQLQGGLITSLVTTLKMGG